MAISITIGGTDYTQYVDMSSFKINANIAVNTDTAEMTINIPNQILPRPKGGQEIIVYNGSHREFGGVIVQPTETALTPRTMSYDVKARDYTYYLDKHLVTNSYTSTTAGNIVKNIIQNYTTGFTTNNVLGTDNSFLIPFMKFDHLAPSACLQKLADAVGLNWWIDYNKDVHFASSTTIPSPLPNNTLLVDTDTQNYGDLTLEEDVSQVRNQIYIMGHKVAAAYTITEKQPTDGNQTSFNLNYEPLNGVSSMVISVGATNYTPMLDLTNGTASNHSSDGKAYVHIKNQTVRFNVAPAAGVLSVTYRPKYEMVNLYNDPNAMTVMQQRDNLDGVYEFVIKDATLSGDDTSLADARGRIELTKYAYPHYSGEFFSYLQGWGTGQYFYLTSNYRMDGYFQKFLFYVVKLVKTIVNHPLNGTPTLYYDITISDSPYVY